MECVGLYLKKIFDKANLVALVGAMPTYQASEYCTSNARSLNVAQRYCV
jgi:hypothetical protein